MSRVSARRDGFALTTTIVAMVVVGLLVTGGFFAASQEHKITLSVQEADAALHAAEHGINTVLGRWTLGNLQQAVNTGPVTYPLRVGETTIAEATVSVKALSGRLYFITSTGRVVRGGVATDASKTLGMLVRTSQLQVASDRAVSAYGGVIVGGNSKVSGKDTFPGEWGEESCPEPAGTLAGIVARDQDLIEEAGSGDIVGEPPVREDPTLTVENMTTFGEWDYDELVARASKHFADGTTINDLEARHTTDGFCDESATPENNLNWGAPDTPSDPCHYYFPIIHADGDLELNGQAKGQGILLVDGNLSIRGGFEFSGMVIVRGRIETGGGESKIFGTITVLGQNSSGLITEISDCEDPNDTDCTYITGKPIVYLSQCAIRRVVEYNKETSRVLPADERTWIDLTGVGVSAT